ncbi:hypothetical protein V5799_023800 [Amblyomma americanum]|uniref:Uncharacterized protein n=1 Tax=Amblyomma americanum TaxID=6943 RepID=A0AAQ4FIK3_AMBAM
MIPPVSFSLQRARHLMWMWPLPREHLLQQSRDARCLVMSFDTLDAPSALPAVSADSGSSQLARIIPTSVVRRVGVDDPKVPRGKESPFRRVVTLKPAVPRAAELPTPGRQRMNPLLVATPCICKEPGSWMSSRPDREWAT